METTASLKIVRSALLVAIVLLFLIDGFRRAIQPDDGSFDFLMSLGLCWAFAAACEVDSWILRKPVCHSFVWLTFFGWPILVPGYLVWSRSLKGFGLAVLAFVLLSALLGVSFMGGRLLVHAR